MNDHDDWEDSTICRSCSADVSPKKLGPGGYCGPCLMEAAEGFDEDDLQDRECMWCGKYAPSEVRIYKGYCADCWKEA